MLVLDRQFGRSTEIFQSVLTLLYNRYAKVMQHV